MSVKVTLMALFLMCLVVPTNLVMVVRSEIKLDFNVYYMFCGEARPSLRLPAFKNYSSAKIKPECQIKFAPSNITKFQQLFKSDVVVQWASLSNDNYHLYQETVFETHPEANPYLWENMALCFCTTENGPTPEEHKSLLDFNGWALISPFYQHEFTDVIRVDEVFSLFLSEFEKHYETSLSVDVVAESKPNFADTLIAHLFSFRHDFVETLQISDFLGDMLLIKEPNSVLEIIEHTFKHDNWEWNWKSRLVVANQTVAYNVTKSIDIPPGKEAFVSHHIQYAVIDIALNEMIWCAVANFTFHHTVHILPPQLVHRLLRLHIYENEWRTHYIGNAVAVNETFVAKGNIIIKDYFSVKVGPMSDRGTRNLHLYIIAGISGVVSLILVFGYLRFRKASNMPKHISNPLIPFGVIHVPGYSNADSDNDAISTTALTTPIDSAHHHCQDLLPGIFRDSNDVNNDTADIDNAHHATNDIYMNNEDNNDASDINSNDAANKSKCDTSNDCNNNSSNINDDNATEGREDDINPSDDPNDNTGNENDNTNPPPNYQNVLADTSDVLRTPSIPVKARTTGIEPAVSDEHIYAEIYDVPRTPSIPLRRAN